MTQFDPNMVAQMLMQPVGKESLDNSIADENYFEAIEIPSLGMVAPLNMDNSGGFFQAPDDPLGTAGKVAYGSAVAGASFIPGAGIVDAAGGAVDVRGQPLLSFGQNIRQGNYLDAGFQALGVAGDVATYAAPLTLGTSAVLGTLLKAPRAAQKITKATDVASDVGSIAKPTTLFEDLQGNPIPVNEDGTITVYHRTNSSVNDIIESDGFFSKENTPEIFVSNKPDGQIVGYGENVIELKIDQEDLQLNDVFSDEAHFTVPIEKANKALRQIDQKGNIAKVEPPTETKPGIIAFHGSGADFDEFKLEKIGTGEGAQAFGYGLYFSDSEDIGTFYKNALTRSVDIDGKPYIRGNSIRNRDLIDRDIADELGAANGDLELAIKNEEEYLQTLTGSQPSNTALTTAAKETQKRIEKLKALRGRVTVNPTEGKTYKVGIEPKKDELLDYDLPLSEQSDFVKNNLKKIGINTEKNKNLSGNEIYNLIARVARERASEKIAEINKKLSSLVRIIDENSVGYRNFTSKAGEDAAKEHDKLLTERSKLPNLTQGKDFTKIASEQLSESGIKGIKFKAGQLSGRQFAIPKEKASENYVIFDDKIIKILEKYGIVGPVAVSATAAALREDDGST
jgi:hypothetical protein